MNDHFQLHHSDMLYIAAKFDAVVAAYRSRFLRRNC